MLGKWNGKTMLLKQKFIVLCCIYVEKSKLDMCRVSNSHTSCLLTNCLQLLPVACAVFKPLVQFNSVTQLCLTLWDVMDYSLPGSSVHGTFQARILEWVAISSFRGSSQPRDWICISCIGRWLLYHWATWEAPRQTQETFILPSPVSNEQC